MGKKRVLIVDDEEPFLKLTKVNLEQTGQYEVRVLSEAAEIMPLVKSFNPDVILLDILMPKIDGPAVCAMLNEDPEAIRIPIITLSALDTDRDKLMMYKQGVVDFLVKPIETSELIAKIEKALEYK